MASVLFLSKYIRTIDEGTPTRHYFFCRKFAEHGHKVKIIKSRSSFATKIAAFKGYFKNEKDGDLDIVTINGPLIPRGFSLKRLLTWFSYELGIIRYIKTHKAYKPDVVIVSSLSLFTFLTGIWLKRKFNIPLIVEVRDIYPLTLQEVAGYKDSNPLIKLMSRIEKKGYTNADHIVSSLDHLDDHVKSVISTPFKFTWIPTGFETSLYADLPSDEDQTTLNAIKQLKSNNKFIVGYAGTIGLANAVDIILEAATQLSNTNPNIVFVFIGNGPLKAAYQEKNADADNVVFLNFVKKQHLPYVLSFCDVLINTWKSSKMYAFGISPNKWNDYMLAARPFIISHDYSSKIFDEANCGWQIATGDVDALKRKIIEVSEFDQEELDSLGANGKRYLEEKLSYEYLSGIYESVFMQAINKAKYV